MLHAVLPTFGKPFRRCSSVGGENNVENRTVAYDVIGFITSKIEMHREL